MTLTDHLEAIIALLNKRPATDYVAQGWRQHFKDDLKEMQRFVQTREDPRTA